MNELLGKKGSKCHRYTLVSSGMTLIQADNPVMPIRRLYIIFYLMYESKLFRLCNFNSNLQHRSSDIPKITKVSWQP